MLHHPCVSTIPYVISTVGGDYKIYGHPLALAAHASVFSSLGDGHYYHVTLSTIALDVRPFLWVWYQINGLSAPECILTIDELLQAYCYLSAFGIAPGADVVKAWWEVTAT